MLFIEGKSFVRMDNFMDLIELKIGFVEQINFGFINMIIFNPQHFIRVTTSQSLCLAGAEPGGTKEDELRYS